MEFAPIQSRRTWLILTALFLYSCSPTAILKRRIDPFLNNLTYVTMSEKDPELVAASFPTNLKIIDALIETHPDNTDLLELGCSAYTMYAYGFVMEEADRTILNDYQAGRDQYQRAGILFERAAAYGSHALEIKYPGFSAWLSGDQIILLHFNKSDVSLLYWTAAALGGEISSSQGDPKMVIRIPEVVRLMEAALELNPGWNNGSLYSAMISLSLSRPDAGDRGEALAREYFQKALAASEGKDVAVFVTMAEKVSVKNQDREEFHAFLEKALSFDVDTNPGNRLSNVIAQRRAQWLLTREEELFY
ncbi:MAG: TRAP transporter TatT component family protein [Fidelibacterota bacterium]